VLELQPYDARPCQVVANESIKAHGDTWKIIVERWFHSQVRSDRAESYTHKPVAEERLRSLPSAQATPETILIDADSQRVIKTCPHCGGEFKS
jgi:hypothetical protein